MLSDFFRSSHYKVFLVTGNHFKTYPSKRKRIKFTDYQQKQLEKFFRQKKFVRGAELLSLSKRLELKPANVKIWFQNHRARQKSKTV